MKKQWDALKPETRHKLTLACVVGVGAFLAMFAQLVSSKPAAPPTPASVRPVTGPDNKIMEKAVTAEAARQAQVIEGLQKQVAVLQGMQGQEGAATGAGSKSSPVTGGSQKTPQPPVQPPPIPRPAPAEKANTVQPPPPIKGQPTPGQMAGRIPLPPGTPGESSEMGGVPGGQSGGQSPQMRQRSKPVPFGGISVLAGGSPEPAKANDDDSKKKEESAHLYLPTGSFMEATLLSGLYAPTTSGARGNPVPVLIRVKAPGQLPNEVKANLKGCFVIAEGLGNLSDERAHLRLVNLSCITKGGDAVVDQKISGYVTDSDGFIGLKGRVVARLGSTIARSLVAGFFGGFGEAMKSSTSNTALTALGAVTTPTTDYTKLAMAGAGQGISDASKQIQQFYLELAKQTVPVIEILPRKKVTMVISQGVKIDVKPLNSKTTL